MAAIQVREGVSRLIFRYAGKQHALTIGQVSKTEAHQFKAKAENLLMRLKQRYMTVPAGISIQDFILFDGRPPADPEQVDRKETTLGELRDKYLVAFSGGALEANTLYTAKLHLNQIEQTLGKRSLLNGLSLAKLQAHVDRRKAKVAAVTVKKEVDTFRSVFNWGRRAKLVIGEFPSAGLVYPKTEEQLPFMTWQQIERRIKAGGGEEFWDNLYLDVDQIAALLEYVKNRKAPSWIYPMVMAAAHTGARRSELIRAKPEDIDLAGGVWTIREKKRKKGTTTTRRTPISKPLAAVLKPWLKTRSSTGYVFGYEDRPLSVQTTHKALVRVLAKSKWKILKGWHTFRHSFQSACAVKGIDARMLREWIGHQSSAMAARYTHLLPSSQKEALASVFG